MKIDRLFVYGTLMRGGRLHNELVTMGAEYLGRGSIQAALFRIRREWYPGAVAGGNSLTWGEVYWLPDVAAALKHLDVVEDVAGAGTFCRVAVTVQKGSLRFPAWTYFYAAPLRGSRRIRSGKFRVKGDI